MFNIVITILLMIVCCRHLYKFGVEDIFDIDFLIVFILVIALFVYNVLILFE